MARVFSAVRVLTIIFFFLALLGMYYDLNLYSKGLVIYFDANQKPVLSTTSNTVFWVSTIFILVLNGLAILLKNLFHALPKPALKAFTPNASFWLKDQEARDHYYAVIDTWLMTFVGVLNMFLVFVILKMWRMNRALKGEITEYKLLTIVAGVIILFFVSYIFIRLRVKKYDVV